MNKHAPTEAGTIVPVRIFHYELKKKDIHDDTRKAELHALFFSPNLWKLAKAFWQHAGTGISSRYAEMILGYLSNNYELIKISEPCSSILVSRIYLFSLVILTTQITIFRMTTLERLMKNLSLDEGFQIWSTVVTGDLQIIEKMVFPTGKRNSLDWTEHLENLSLKRMYIYTLPECPPYGTPTRCLLGSDQE